MRKQYKVDDYVTWSTSDNFTSAGTVVKIISNEKILVDTGKGGGYGYEYISPNQIKGERT